MKTEYEKLPDYFDLKLREAICKKFNIETRELLKKIRTRDIVEPRQVYFTLLQDVFCISTIDIEKSTGFDHATVLHSKNKTYQLIDVDKSYNIKFDYLLLFSQTIKNQVNYGIVEKNNFIPRTRISSKFSRNYRIGVRTRVTNATF